MLRGKIKLVFVVMGVLLINAFVVYLISLEYQFVPKRDFQKFTGAPDISLKGLSFVETQDGREIFSLDIGSFKIRKIKLGFFRVGLFKTAELENVEINFYINENVKGITKEPFDFEKCFLASELPGLEKVRGVEIKNIKINIMQENRIISSISSDYAEIDLARKDVIFKGNVKISSQEDKVLRCYRIRWVNKTNRFKTNDFYKLTKEGKAFEGKGLETDYLLENIRFLM
jgi:hypothetical protein